MIKYKTIEVWIDETMEDAKECADKAISEATGHYYVCDGTVEFKEVTEDKDLESEGNSSKNAIILSTDQEMIRLCKNGNIFIKKRLVENDIDVVRGMQEFMSKTSNNI